MKTFFTSFPRFILAFLALHFLGHFILVPSAGAQKNKAQSVRTKVNSPEEELAGFKLPAGFVMELVASERDGVINPVDLTFDDAGRLWTQTASMYPLDPIADIQWNDLLKLMNDPEAQKKHPDFKRIKNLYEGKTKGTDKVIVLSELYGNHPVKSTVWADGLTIPMSILPYKNGAYIAQGSEMFFLNDGNRDGKADERIPLFTGFGFTDTHTMAHVLVRAPGNWIHFSHGALNKGEVISYKNDSKLKIDYSKIARFSMDARKMELVSAGLNNIWGFQLRGNGQWYGSEANDLGYSVVPMEPGTAFPGIGNERLRSYQPFMPELHEFRVGGTGISGTAFADDASGSFPDTYRNVAFLANPITNSINAVRITRNADGTVSAKHLPDLLTSEDDWFRPVNIEFGPDGCLYIADWYNKIVSHNELPTTHPDRGKTHGRIWRIRHTSQKSRVIPDLNLVKTEDLAGHLTSPSLWQKRAAWHQISDRPKSETKLLATELVKMASNENLDEVTRIHALWSLEGIQFYDSKLISSLLDSASDDLKREAARSLNSFDLNVSEIASHVKNLIEDKNPAVRSQVIRTLTDAGTASQPSIEILLRACKPELPGNTMGGSYERKFERFLARKALEQYPVQLQKRIDFPIPEDIPLTNILWAVQALPDIQKEAAFLKFFPQANIGELDESTFISISQMLKNKEIYEMLKPVVHNPAFAKTYVNFALQNQSQIQSSELSGLLKIPVVSLLKNKAQSEIDLGLDAIGRLKIPVSHQEIIGLVNEQTTDKTLMLALRAMEFDLTENQTFFMEAVKNKKLSLDVRLYALNNLAKADQVIAQKALTEWIPDLNATEKAEIVNSLARSASGSALLLNLLDRKALDLSLFNLSSAELILNSNKKDSRSLAVMEEVKKREEEKKKAFRGKLNKYMTIAGSHQGNPENGKVLFQTCLMCHRVGKSGQNIAPALDGSASRENEALLTAILDPDAAVESGYAVYRILKKDGSSLEGYLVGKDAMGTTIALMGGSKLFVEAGNIKNQGFLGGRSFMVKGLIDNYTDKQVADLLSYIKTLK